MREIKFRAWDKQLNVMIYAPNDNIFFPALSRQREIMQFTGLKDKNGKEIYEGDIVVSTFGDGIHSIIKFGEYPDKQGATNIGFYIYKGGSFEVGFGCSVEGDTKCFEVIGNIYENVDLLP